MPLHLYLCSKIGSRPLSIEEEEDMVLAGIPLTHQDFQNALDQLQAAHSDAIGAPKVRFKKCEKCAHKSKVWFAALSTALVNFRSLMCNGTTWGV